MTRSRLRKLTQRRREIFTCFTRIEGVSHRINLKEGAEPVCSSQRRRSPKEEDL